VCDSAPELSRHFSRSSSEIFLKEKRHYEEQVQSARHVLLVATLLMTVASTPAYRPTEARPGRPGGACSGRATPHWAGAHGRAGGLPGRCQLRPCSPTRNRAWSSARMPSSASDRSDGVHRYFQHSHIVHVGRRLNYRERDPMSVDRNTALRARFAAVRRVRPCFFVPPAAGTLAESSEARD